MTYQEIINNIRSLGFSDDAEMEEFATEENSVLYDSINRAITYINLHTAPIIGKYDFELDDTDEGILYITMPDIDSGFLDFADTPVLYERNDKEYYERFSNYDIEADDTLVINADTARGSFRVFYKKAHETFNGTQLSQQCPLPLKVHHLVPLLASYYVWLEDEPAKAAQFYNQYETEESKVIASSETAVRVKVMYGGI